MNDLISRQQAIDEANAWLLDCFKVNKQDRSCGLIRRLEDLPSAQPEIIRCKDCKHHWTHRCMDSMPIERCDLEQTFYDAEVDYCSLAERREVTT